MKASEWGTRKPIVGGVAVGVYEKEEGIFFEDLSLEILHNDELSRLLTFPNVLVTTADQAFSRAKR